MCRVFCCLCHPQKTPLERGFLLGGWLPCRHLAPSIQLYELRLSLARHLASHYPVADCLFRQPDGLRQPALGAFYLYRVLKYGFHAFNCIGKKIHKKSTKPAKVVHNSTHANKHRNAGQESWSRHWVCPKAEHQSIGWKLCLRHKERRGCAVTTWAKNRKPPRTNAGCMAERLGNAEKKALGNRGITQAAPQP